MENVSAKIRMELNCRLQVNLGLKEEAQEKLVEVLENYSDCFATEDEEGTEDRNWLLSVSVEEDHVVMKGQLRDWSEFIISESGDRKTGFAIKHGKLFKEERTAHGVNYRLFVPDSLREEVLLACHDNITSGYLGQTRTFAKIKERYFWEGMKKDVDNYVRRCRSCQSRGGVYRRQAGFLEISAVEKPFGRIGVDILGQFPKFKKGNRYVIIAVDYATKWAGTRAVLIAGAEQVAEFLVKDVVLRHAAQRTLTTDQGKCFIAK